MMNVGEDQTGADTTHQARNFKSCGPLFLQHDGTRNGNGQSKMRIRLEKELEILIGSL